MNLFIREHILQFLAASYNVKLKSTTFFADSKLPAKLFQNLIWLHCMIKAVRTASESQIVPISSRKSRTRQIGTISGGTISLTLIRCPRILKSRGALLIEAIAVFFFTKTANLFSVINSALFPL
jgi:hypothetical protein